jgi:hypothetical protein
VLVDGVPAEVVVEVDAHLTAGSAVPRRPNPPPPPGVASFLERLGRAEDLAYRSARERRPDLMRRALEALPLDLDGPTAHALARHICRAEASP